MWCIIRHYFGNDTPQWSWFGLTVLFKGGNVTDGIRAITGVIHHVRSYLWKPTMRKCLDAHSLNRWQAHMNLLLVFTFCNLLFVTTHLRQCKKVSILPPGDVNPGSVVSRRGLLEDSPYRAVRAAVHRAMSHDHVPGWVETWKCLVATYVKHEFVLVTYAALFMQR
jgi:hypothetical protein